MNSRVSMKRFIMNETRKTVTSKTHIKATASLQKQIDEELKCTGTEQSISNLIELEDKKGKKENNENTTGKN